MSYTLCDRDRLSIRSHILQHSNMRLSIRSRASLPSLEPDAAHEHVPTAFAHPRTHAPFSHGPQSLSPSTSCSNCVREMRPRFSFFISRSSRAKSSSSSPLSPPPPLPPTRPGGGDPARDPATRHPQYVMPVRIDSLPRNVPVYQSTGTRESAQTRPTYLRGRPCGMRAANLRGRWRGSAPLSSLCAPPSSP